MSVRNGKMKKLIIFNPGSALYGAEQGVRNLVKALGDDYAITVVTPEEGPLGEAIKKGPVPAEVISFPLAVVKKSFSPLYYLFFPVLFLINTIYFMRYIRRKGIDLVCTNSLFIAWASIMAAGSGKRHIWYIREMFDSNLLNTLCSWLLRKIPGEIICASCAVRETLLLPADTPVIYDPIDPERYTLFDRTAARNELCLPEGATVISCISRIHPSKGQYELLTSLYPLLKESENIRMIFVGDISPRTWRTRRYKKKMCSFIRNHSLDNVLYWGFRGDIDKILSASDICVFPFLRKEPFGIAVAEALSFGKITFFPHSGGPAEIAALFGRGEDFRPDSILAAVKNPPREDMPGGNLFIPEELSFSRYKEKIRSVF